MPSDLPVGVAEGLPSLTRAERNVLRHLASNKTSREMWQSLYISVRTVQNHRARICDKLGLRGNNALLGVALRLRDHLGPPED
jgi:DNA-binding CsgD family transcriptional regulator